MERYEENGPLHEMFRRQVKKTPDRLAVVTEDGRQMTYKELDSTTDTLATWLQIGGVMPDSVVGIYMERCMEYAVSYIAILKAGQFLG
ncbi:hypothetical protein LSH36_48g05010 [Paralvinella palmiformis]|uniref:AMP-dependent synthetase/ligase domain-containing protein n=1 Tax=Paralvinella palmiformis TaxID=53620 RepID=A0AAD9NEQ5_9ANNE|nr:hypothetical protein LSH36_48g05010 [Paralvinella palmiformis]